MSCPVETVFLNRPKTIDFTSCFQVSPSASYGLENYTIQVSVQGQTGDMTTTATWPLSGTGEFLLFMTKQGRNLFLNTVNKPPNVTILPFKDNIPVVLVTFTATIGVATDIRYEFFLDDVTVTIPQTRVQGQKASSLNGSLQLPDEQSVPRITARSFSTPDGEQICSLDFQLLFEENCGLKERFYRQYCAENKKYDMRFWKVIDAPGCTLAEQLIYLEEKKGLLDRDQFLQYMVVRYVLYGFFFGRFTIAGLLQCKAQKLNQALLGTPWAIFLPLLKNPLYASYFLPC